MPVGERTLLLIVLAPLAGVRVTLAVLLALGVVAAAWTTAGRLGRTVLAGRGAGGALSQTRWLRPALARAAEQLAVAGLVAWLAPSALPGAFAWLAVVAFGLYDLVYRQRLAGVSGVQALLAGRAFGWPVRVVLVLVVLLAAGERAGDVLVVASALLAAAVLTSSARFWGRWIPSTP
jgi:hypothetical protein